MRKFTELTTVNEVFRVLVEADDFMTARQISAKLPTHKSHNVMTALGSLRRYRAVNAIASPNAIHWYATPEYDTRMKTVVERVPESKPRKAKRRKV